MGPFAEFAPTWEWLQNFPTEYAAWWWNEYQTNPVHVYMETFLLLLAAYILLFKRQYDPAKKGHGARKPAPLTEHEISEILDEWEPEPLVPAAMNGQRANMREAANAVVVEEALEDGKHLLVEGIDTPVLQCASKDWLALGSSAPVKAAAVAAVEEYSYGSCGPRGFYGTTLKHLELEEAIADFMGVPEAITYSDASAAVSSVIPAFAKRGDLLVLDDGANHAMQTGARLARSTVMTYKHNDMADLRRVLQEVAAQDAKNPGRATQHRRFIVFEGVSASWGDIAPLPDILALGREFKLRTIMDDSLGWGVLGATGRGTTEHHGLSTLDVTVIVASMSNTLVSPGGFVVGSRDVTDHQRLSGAGYVFSASTPPALCATGTAALGAMRSAPELLGALASAAGRTHASLASAGVKTAPARAVAAGAKRLAGSAGVEGAIAGGLWRMVSHPAVPMLLLQLTGAAPAAVRAVAGAIGAYRAAQDTAAGRRARRNLATPHAVRGVAESMPLTQGGFLRATGGVTQEEVEGMEGDAVGAASRPAGAKDASPATMLALAAERPEMEAVLDAVVREALTRGVLLTRTQAVPGDNLAPPPALRVQVTAAHTPSDAAKITTAVTGAVKAVLGRYVGSAEGRVAAITAATDLLLSAGSLAEAMQSPHWAPPPVLLHLSALTDVPPAAHPMAPGTPAAQDVLYHDTLSNPAVYGGDFTPASRKATTPGASEEAMARATAAIVADCARYTAEVSNGTGRVPVSAAKAPVVNGWIGVGTPKPEEGTKEGDASPTVSDPTEGGEDSGAEGPVVTKRPRRSRSKSRRARA